MRQRGLSVLHSNWIGIAGSVGLLAALMAVNSFVPSPGSETTVSAVVTAQMDENAASMVGIASAGLLGFGLVTHYLVTLDLRQFRVLLPGLLVVFVGSFVGGIVGGRILGVVAAADFFIAATGTVIILAPLAVLVGTTRYGWHLATS